MKTRLYKVLVSGISTDDKDWIMYYIIVNRREMLFSLSHQSSRIVKVSESNLDVVRSLLDGGYFRYIQFNSDIIPRYRNELFRFIGADCGEVYYDYEISQKDIERCVIKVTDIDGWEYI